MEGKENGTNDEISLQLKEKDIIQTRVNERQDEGDRIQVLYNILNNARAKNKAFPKMSSRHCQNPYLGSGFFP